MLNTVGGTLITVSFLLHNKLGKRKAGSLSDLFKTTKSPNACLRVQSSPPQCPRGTRLCPRQQAELGTGAQKAWKHGHGSPMPSEMRQAQLSLLPLPHPTPDLLSAHSFCIFPFGAFLPCSIETVCGLSSLIHRKLLEGKDHFVMLTIEFPGLGAY